MSPVAPVKSTADSFATASTPRLRVVRAGEAAPVAAATWQPALPLQWELPGGLPAEPPQVEAPRLSVVAGPPGHRPGELPHPVAWVTRLAPAIFEVLAGVRPVSQLARWTARDIWTTLARRHDAARRHPAGRLRQQHGRTVRGVRVQPVAPGIVEASAVVAHDDRCRAIALRLEVIGRECASGPRWLITACDIG
jgi:hypothetical protein